MLTFRGIRRAGNRPRQFIISGTRIRLRSLAFAAAEGAVACVVSVVIGKNDQRVLGQRLFLKRTHYFPNGPVEPPQHRGAKLRLLLVLKREKSSDETASRSSSAASSGVCTALNAA